MKAFMPPQNAKQSNRRSPRWFRFSVRMLLLVMAVMAVALALTMSRLHGRKAAVASIHAIGGTMGVSIGGPEWLRNLIGDDECFYEPQRISLGPIAKDNPPLDDELLASVANSLLAFGELRALDIRRSAVTDKSAPLLAKLDTLTHLRLSDTQITDDAIPYINQLPNLQSLMLANTRLTDACIDDLVRISTLTSLDIRGTQISQAAVSRLKKSLPACRISN